MLPDALWNISVVFYFVTNYCNQFVDGRKFLSHRVSFEGFWLAGGSSTHGSCEWTLGKNHTCTGSHSATSDFMTSAVVSLNVCVCVCLCVCMCVLVHAWLLLNIFYFYFVFLVYATVHKVCELSIIFSVRNKNYICYLSVYPAIYLHIYLSYKYIFCSHSISELYHEPKHKS